MVFFLLDIFSVFVNFKKPQRDPNTSMHLYMQFPGRHYLSGALTGPSSDGHRWWPGLLDLCSI